MPRLPSPSFLPFVVVLLCDMISNTIRPTFGMPNTKRLCYTGLDSWSYRELQQRWGAVCYVENVLIWWGVFDFSGHDGETFPALGNTSPACLICLICLACMDCIELTAFLCSPDLDYLVLTRVSSSPYPISTPGTYRGPLQSFFYTLPPTWNFSPTSYFALRSLAIRNGD